MKIISWKLRGIQGKSRQRFLQNRIEGEKPDILMLEETKSMETIAKQIIQKTWGTLEEIATDSQGYSGGMALACNQDSIQMETYWTTKRTITKNFHYIGTNIIGFITSVYGPNIPQEKYQFQEIYTTPPH